MTKILVISRSWPPKERTGVSLAAHKHAQLLLNLGYEVAVLGAKDQTDLNDIGISNAAVISAKGTGAIYAPVRINKFELRNFSTFNFVIKSLKISILKLKLKFINFQRIT
jgi:hypothetical protein